VLLLKFSVVKPGAVAHNYSGHYLTFYKEGCNLWNRLSGCQGGSLNLEVVIASNISKNRIEKN